MRTSNVRRASRAVALGVMLLAASTTAHAANGQYDEVIQRMLKEGRNDFPVIVRYKDNASKQRHTKALKGQRAQLRRELKKLRAIGVRTNRALLLSMLADRDVEGVSYDAPVRASQIASLPPVPESPTRYSAVTGEESLRNRWTKSATPAGFEPAFMP